ncbi:MAG: cupin domain-containing protein [Acetobacteraceae bacterium]|nr:cupin domain-containing protein [Acetobacteraceae bacterium]
MDGTVETRAPMKLAISRKSAPNYTQGRRTFFKYRDLGVAEATGGSMRAQVMEGITGMTEPTGWHVHHCQAQFVYIIKGWVDLEFEDGTRTRLEVGDSVMIPGEMRHNEFGTSPDVEILELSVPGPMGTTPCDPPANMSR